MLRAKPYAKKIGKKALTFFREKSKQKSFLKIKI